MPEPPQTRFARSGDAYVAYQMLGSGPDLLLVDTWVHHVEAVWDVPELARFLRRLASFSRLIHFDRRGTGLSDPVPIHALPDFEQQVSDALAVLDAAGSERAAVLGLNDGTAVAMLLAAGHPERCDALVLFAATVRHELAAGMPMEDLDAVIEEIESSQVRGESGVEVLAPSRVNDERFTRHLSRLQRSSVRPGAIGHFYRQSMTPDLTPVPPGISTRTLVLNRAANRIVPAKLSTEVAHMIPGARYVELPGTDHLPYSQDLDAVVDEIEEFLTGARSGTDADRILATLLFTDIVGSTTLTAELGDRGWRDLLDQHHALVRAQLERFRGREVATTGDGFFATFDGPARAVRCAREILHSLSSALGLDVRAGVHMGEVDVRGRDLGGLAVHVAARIAGLAAGREVLVSSTVKDVLFGSGLSFEDRGEHDLKGLPGRWRLFAATGS